MNQNDIDKSTKYGAQNCGTMRRQATVDSRSPLNTERPHDNGEKAIGDNEKRSQRKARWTDWNKSSGERTNERRASMPDKSAERSTESNKIVYRYDRKFRNLDKLGGNIRGNE